LEQAHKTLKLVNLTEEIHRLVMVQQYFAKLLVGGLVQIRL
jgi:hypothetical protein